MTQLGILAALKDDVKSGLSFTDTSRRISEIKNLFYGEVLEELQELELMMNRGIDRAKICGRLNYVLLTIMHN